MRDFIGSNPIFTAIFKPLNEKIHRDAPLPLLIKILPEDTSLLLGQDAARLVLLGETPSQINDELNLLPPHLVEKLPLIKIEVVWHFAAVADCPQ